MIKNYQSNIKNFAAHESRPILQCQLVEKKDNLVTKVITNSYIMLRENQIVNSPITSDFKLCQNILNGKIEDPEKYPNISRVIEPAYIDDPTNLKLDDIKNIIQNLKANKKSLVTFENNKLKFESGATFDITDSDIKYEITFTSELLLKIFTVILDANKEFFIHTSGNLKPVLFISTDKEIELLICPIRKEYKK